MHKHTNNLIHSTSPYLLQHAHNPVKWEEWSEEILKKAKQEDKPILVSIGYSSCHWCHVMEKESFENEEVARLMNDFFICIKVDREERPDVDHLYMDAIHAMGLSGGWPLNVFLTPDQKPFYGGTYFPKKQWMNLLMGIAETFQKRRTEIDESAEGFAKSLTASVKDKYTLVGDKSNFTAKEMNGMYEELAKQFDDKWGGMDKAPKFPMPCVWEMLATYGKITNNQQALNHLFFTLDKIADGGIYDQIGGGFARYSVDGEWHVPHFEKMLYDNGQLLSLYANAYKLSSWEKYKNVILETVEWLEREMMDKSGGFYAALDADSEGEEGKFYVWSEEEISTITGKNYELISEYYDVSKAGNWEGKNVLRILHSKEKLLEKHSLSEGEFDEIIANFKKKALKERSKKIRPGLDNKIIAGWNGLTLSGLCISYQALQNEDLLRVMKQNAAFIKGYLIENGKLKRFPNKPMEGFIEDYAAVIQAFIHYYETTQEEEFLLLAKQLTERANEQFYDETEKLYFFSSNENAQLIARKKELFDNVIPSSNSMMAWNLVHLGTFFYNDEWINQGKEMLEPLHELCSKEPTYLANWAKLGLELSLPFAKIVISGNNAKNIANKLNQKFIPNKILAASEKPSNLPIFEHKDTDDEATIFVCYDKACKLPTKNLKEAMEQIKERF